MNPLHVDMLRKHNTYCLQKRPSYRHKCFYVVKHKCKQYRWRWASTSHNKECLVRFSVVKHRRARERVGTRPRGQASTTWRTRTRRTLAGKRGPRTWTITSGPLVASWSASSTEPVAAIDVTILIYCWSVNRWFTGKCDRLTCKWKQKPFASLNGFIKVGRTGQYMILNYGSLFT